MQYFRRLISGGGGKESRETLPPTNKVFITWAHVIEPSLKELSERLGFQINPTDIQYMPAASGPGVDALDFFRKPIEETIKRQGLPKALIAADISIFLECNPDTRRNYIIPPTRSREDVIAMLKKLADQYGIQFFDLPEVSRSSE